MILRNNDRLNINDKTFSIGEAVWVNRASDYAGLIGRITEIRTDGDKETENEGPEICCSFDVPERDAVVREIEARFSKLYQMPKQIGDLALDNVIMAPETLEAVAETLPDAVDKLYALSRFKDNDSICGTVVLGVSTDRSVLIRMMLDDADSCDIPVVLTNGAVTQTGTHYMFESNEMAEAYIFIDYAVCEAPVYLSAKGVCAV